MNQKYPELEKLLLEISQSPEAFPDCEKDFIQGVAKLYDTDRDSAELYIEKYRIIVNKKIDEQLKENYRLI